jgi:hypothetical protein
MTDAQGGNAARQRIQIKIPEKYKGLDEAVWKDLEEYLFVGFLSSPANLIGNSFVFKTLNHQEIRNINYMRPPGAAETNVQFKAAFIAYSLFVAMGRNVLFKRAENIDKLIELISKIPSAYQDKIVDNLNFLNKKAHRLHPLVEAYVHESRSRYKWLYLKKLPIHSLEATGIPGTSELGMNYCQQTWIAMNEALDEKNDAETDWNHAKFIGSCFAGKGMMSVDEQDRARKNRERQEIEENKINVLREYIGASSGKPVESLQGTITLPDGRRAVVEGRFKAETAEELADQLSSALSGEKDWHDKAVADHFRRVKVEREVMAKQSRQIAAIPNRLLTAGTPTAGGGARVLNREDADEYVKRMQALMIHPPIEASSPPDISAADIDRSGLRGR